jgi:isopentenyl-diphosphate delta-isomerase
LDDVNLLRKRKRDHIEICSQEDVAHRYRFWNDIHLVHEALPELDMAEIDLSTTLFGKKLKAPIIIAAMTGGFEGGKLINRNLAEAASRTGVGMGVGSQRSVLSDSEMTDSYSVVKEFKVPLMIGNIGAPQLIKQGKKPALTFAQLEQLRSLVGADLMAVHLNFLQEAAQWEGDTQSNGAFAAIEALSKKMKLIAKETGAGISRETARKLMRTDIAGIDIGGAGGTSFAAVEVHRARRVAKDPQSPEVAERAQSSERLGMTFRDWGIPAPVSVIELREMHRTFPIIATGGICSGLDIARAISLGANAAGLATQFLEPAMCGVDAVVREIEMLKKELRAAMLLTGSKDLEALGRARYIISGECAHWINRP